MPCTQFPGKLGVSLPRVGSDYTCADLGLSQKTADKVVGRGLHRHRNGGYSFLLCPPLFLLASLIGSTRAMRPSCFIFRIWTRVCRPGSSRQSESGVSLVRQRRFESGPSGNRRKDYPRSQILAQTLPGGRQSRGSGARRAARLRRS